MRENGRDALRAQSASPAIDEDGDRRLGDEGTP